MQHFWVCGRRAFPASGGALGIDKHSGQRPRGARFGPWERMLVTRLEYQFESSSAHLS